mmetsp:Transcript_10671/g.37897  ORF Transcript_10671/g.37897 Transcript_10671/m.37897 type:complete len:236 (-) Transcript_10671:416-1123(-)
MSILPRRPRSPPRAGARGARPPSSENPSRSSPRPACGRTCRTFSVKKKKKKKKQAVASWERMRSVRKMQHVLGPRHTTDETRYDKSLIFFGRSECSRPRVQSPRNSPELSVGGPPQQVPLGQVRLDVSVPSERGRGGIRIARCRGRIVVGQESESPRPLLRRPVALRAPERHLLLALDLSESPLSLSSNFRKIESFQKVSKVFQGTIFLKGVVVVFGATTRRRSAETRVGRRELR